jgi:hypothetical protein
LAGKWFKLFLFQLLEFKLFATLAVISQGGMRIVAIALWLNQILTNFSSQEVSPAQIWLKIAHMLHLTNIVSLARVNLR